MHPFVLMMAAGTLVQLCLSAPHRNPNLACFSRKNLAAEFQADDWLPPGESMMGKEMVRGEEERRN